MSQLNLDYDLKMLFGFLLLLIDAVLIAAIALGTVRQESSYGLNEVLLILSGLSAAWAQWAFGPPRPPTPPQDPKT